MKLEFAQRIKDTIDNITLRLKNPAGKAAEFSFTMNDLAAGTQIPGLTREQLTADIERAVELYHILDSKFAQGVMPNGFVQAKADLESALDIVTLFADNNDVRLAASEDVKELAQTAARFIIGHPYTPKEVRQELGTL